MSEVPLYTRPDTHDPPIPTALHPQGPAWRFSSLTYSSSYPNGVSLAVGDTSVERFGLESQSQVQNLDLFVFQTKTVKKNSGDPFSLGSCFPCGARSSSSSFKSSSLHSHVTFCLEGCDKIKLSNLLDVWLTTRLQVDQLKRTSTADHQQFFGRLQTAEDDFEGQLQSSKDNFEGQLQSAENGFSRNPKPESQTCVARMRRPHLQLPTPKILQ